MLESIRHHAKGLVGYIIAIAISLTFVLWGIGDYLSWKKPPVAAEVNGESIPQKSFERRFDLAKQRYQDANIDPTKLREMVLKTMVDEILIDQLAKSIDLNASTMQILALIRQMPEFQQDGIFSKSKFKQILDLNNLSEADFFNLAKKQVIERQYRMFFQGASILAPGEALDFYQLVEQTRTINYRTFKVSDFLSKVDASNIGELEKFYNEHKDSFVAPESVDVSYFRFGVAHFSSNVAATEEEIETYFSQHAKELSKPEWRLVAHIQISAENKLAIDALEVALKDNSAHFETLAKTYSEDALTKNKGGVIGWMKRDDDTPFVKEAFENKIAEINEVELNGNRHWVKVVEVKAGKEKLDDLRDEVIQRFKSERAETHFSSAIDALDEALFESSTIESLANIVTHPVSKVAHLMVESEWPASLEEPKIRKILFDRVELPVGKPTMVDLGGGQTLVLVVDKHVPSQVKPFAEVQQEVSLLYSKDQARSLAKKSASEYLEQLKDAVANQTPETTQLTLTRESSDFLPAVQEVVFAVTADSWQLVEAEDGAHIFRVAKVLAPKTFDGDADMASLLYGNSLKQFQSNLMYNESRQWFKADSNIEGL